jgi:hypothetical protein
MPSSLQSVAVCARKGLCFGIYGVWRSGYEIGYLGKYLILSSLGVKEKMMCLCLCLCFFPFFPFFFF